MALSYRRQSSVPWKLTVRNENGTTHWRDAIRKEMAAVGKAFEILYEGATAPVGHTLIEAHMMFDIKPDFTRRKATRLVVVAGWRAHDRSPSIHLTYASVVSRESMRSAFLIAALNDLGVLAADIIGNAYLNARTKERKSISFVEKSLETSEYVGTLEGSHCSSPLQFEQVQWSCLESVPS
jgi:hypothetical protein